MKDSISAEKAAAECVSDDALIHLKTYKYSAVDKSPVSNYILKPYWNAFVEFLPLWVAPNMVTLIGFGFIVANVGLLLIFIPDLVGPGPSWLYFSFAFGLFAYQTMDNVDGKQARRTGTSSGLGELFDHGIDSLNCTLASLLETAAMGLGTTKAGVFTALCPCLPMWFSTWETYHTHTLYLGYINGPTEGILIACLLMAISGWYGPEIWTERLADNLHLFSFLGLTEENLGDTSFQDIWVYCLIGAMFVHIPFCIINVVNARLSRNEPLLPVFLEWTPIVVFTLSVGAWLYSPYSTLMAENHLVLFCVCMCFVFGRMTTKMILAHLTKQPFPFWTVMLWPLLGGAFLGNLPRFGLPAVTAQFEHLYLWAYLVFAFVVYSRWAWLVTTSICDFLGINCLTIPHEKQMANKQIAREIAAQAAAAVPVGPAKKD
ncbi:CDP-alcohol phosphatidyltransferase-domain-containing protein [Copromyces sp. CBS 386.78]|nr:CDP-alcohol phosphatidyltransferase-domain-containing protein [Copromyces sp. CBS 386.78]